MSGGMRDTNGDTYWRRVEDMVVLSARRRGLNINDAEDCAADFERKNLSNAARQTAELVTPELLKRLRRDIRWHVKDWIYQRGKATGDIASLDEILERAQAGLAAEPASPEPGPEELAMIHAELELAQRVVDTMSLKRQWLWRRVVVEGARLVDLAAESGRTANALYVELRVIRGKIIAQSGVGNAEK